MKIKNLALLVIIFWLVLIGGISFSFYNYFNQLEIFENKLLKVNNLKKQFEVFFNTTHDIVYFSHEKDKLSVWEKEVEDLTLVLDSFKPLYPYARNITNLEELKTISNDFQLLFKLYLKKHDQRYIYGMTDVKSHISTILLNMSNTIILVSKEIKENIIFDIKIILFISLIFSIMLALLVWRGIVRPISILSDHFKKHEEFDDVPKLDSKYFFELNILNDSIHDLIDKRKEKENEIFYQKDFLQLVFDAIPECSITSDGIKMINVNKKTLDFFGYENFEALHSEHFCICDFFEEEEGFVTKEIKGMKWTEYILDNPGIYHALVMKDNKRHIFEIGVNRLEKKIEFLVVLKDVTRMEEELELIQYQIEHDPLTGIYNRKKFNDLLFLEVKRYHRKKQPFSVVILDIDHFKNVNDTFGHLVGDDVLIGLSSHILQHKRETDVFARWGGEEFVLLLFDTSKENAFVFLERLRKSIEEKVFPTVGGITCSFGVTQYKDNDTLDVLFERCDKALYEAKESGRNKVIVK